MMIILINDIMNGTTTMYGMKSITWNNSESTKKNRRKKLVTEFQESI